MVPGIDEDWSDYKVHFSSAFDIDIPEDMRRCVVLKARFKITVSMFSLDKYCATLAHKCNHSFTPNLKWGRIDHPR